MKVCVICKRQVVRPKWTITIADHEDFQPHAIHGTCLDRLWKWAHGHSEPKVEERSNGPAAFKEAI